MTQAFLYYKNRYCILNINLLYYSRIMKLLPALVPLLFFVGCQQLGTIQIPKTITNSASSFVFEEPYVFYTGLLKYRHEFPAGRYSPVWQDATGLYYRFNGPKADVKITMLGPWSETGIYILADRSRAYVWAVNKDVDANAAVEILGVGGAAIAEALFPTPKEGTVSKPMRITGDIFSAIKWQSLLDSQSSAQQ